jgi:hypothetical protein
MQLIIQEVSRPARERRRPPRHARPKGWAGATERAPFPIMADPQEGYGVWPFLLGTGEMSPLNREVMRTRFRVMWHQSQRRPVV